MEQLDFAIRYHLHLGRGGGQRTAVHHMPCLDDPVIKLRPGVHLNERLGSMPEVELGGRYVAGNILQDPRRRDFVAVSADEKLTDGAGVERTVTVIWYAQLVLCFLADYSDAEDGRGRHHLCYVRWLDTVRAAADNEARPPRTRPRALTAVEQAGPFELYRWATRPPGCGEGHPAARGPCYGVVRARDVMYRVHMLPTIVDAGLFRLNTDVWEL